MVAFVVILIVVLLIVGYYDFRDLKQEASTTHWAVYSTLLAAGFALTGYFTLNVLAPDIMLPIRAFLQPLNGWMGI